MPPAPPLVPGSVPGSGPAVPELAQGEAMGEVRGGGGVVRGEFERGAEQALALLQVAAAAFEDAPVDPGVDRAGIGLGGGLVEGGRGVGPSLHRK